MASHTFCLNTERLHSFTPEPGTYDVYVQYATVGDDDGTDEDQLELAREVRHARAGPGATGANRFVDTHRLSAWIMLELYQSEGCPHCKKVREKLSELGLSYVAHNPRLPGGAGGDVTNDVTHEELAAGGHDQIPYLVDTDRHVTLYESDAIVEYLDEHYA